MSDKKPEDEPLWCAEHFGELEINPNPKFVRINIHADQTVEIDKLYGPRVVMAIRTRVELTPNEWVIEQEFLIEYESGESDTEWREVARFPCDYEPEKRPGEMP